MDTENTKVDDTFAARLMLFMFHQLSAEWAQTVDTEKWERDGRFWQLDSLLDAADG